MGWMEDGDKWVIVVPSWFFVMIRFFGCWFRRESHFKWTTKRNFWKNNLQSPTGYVQRGKERQKGCDHSTQLTVFGYISTYQRTDQTKRSHCIQFKTKPFFEFVNLTPCIEKWYFDQQGIAANGSSVNQPIAVCSDPTSRKMVFHRWWMAVHSAKN